MDEGASLEDAAYSSAEANERLGKEIGSLEREQVDEVLQLDESEEDEGVSKEEDMNDELKAIEGVQANGTSGFSRVKGLSSYTSVGNREIEAPLSVVRAKFRARKESSGRTAVSDGEDKDDLQFANVVRLDMLEVVTSQLEEHASKSQGGAGLPTSIAVHRHFFAVGTSRSVVLIYDHGQRLKKVYSKGRQHDKLENALKFALSSEQSFGAVTSMDTVTSGMTKNALLAIGFSKGRIEIWDMSKHHLLRTFIDGPNAHTCSVCIIRFVGTGGARSNRFDTGNGTNAPKKPFATLVSCDTSGSVNMLILTKTLMLTNLDSKCLLDGKAGQIISMAASEMLNLVAISSRRDTFLVSLDNGTARIVHRWPNAGLTEGCLPRLAWGEARLSDDLTRQKSPFILARACGKTVKFLRCSISLESETKEKEQSYVESKDSFEETSSSPGANFMAIEWLNESLVALLSVDFELRVLDATAMTILEATNIRNIELVWTPFSSDAFAFQNSVRTTGAKLFLLGMKQLSVARVQQWKERVETLIAHGGWLEALALALDFFHLSGQRTRQDMQDLIIRFVSESPIATNRPSIAATIEFCIETEQVDLLFDTIYEILVQYGMRTIFLHLLEPYILNRLLTVVRPNVLQDFVEDYMTNGLEDRLEQCILHLTPDTIRTDLHTLVNVCKDNKLLSGLVYLYNAGLNDFETPARVLLELGEIGKLMAYLETSFRGLTYPFAFPMESGPDGVAFVRVTLLGFVTDHMKPIARALILEADDASELFSLCRIALGNFQDEWEARLVFAIRILDPAEATSLLISRLLLHPVEGLENDPGPILVQEAFQHIMDEIRDEEMMTSVIRHCNPKFYDVGELTNFLKGLCWSRALTALHEIALQAAIADGHDLKRLQAVFEQIIEVSDAPAAFVQKQLLQLSSSPMLLSALEKAVKKKLSRLLVNESERGVAAQIIVRLIADPKDLHGYPELQFLHMKNTYMQDKLDSLVSSSIVRDQTNAVRFIELMCTFEVDAVLEFLDENDGLYPLDDALAVCRNYNHRAAMAYLLERTGEISAALDVLLESLKEMQDLFDQEEARKIVQSAIQLCERNSIIDLDPANAELLWFELLNAVSEFGPSASLRQVLDAMMNFVESEEILNKVKADSFGKIRHTVQCMIDARVYEKYIMRSATRIAKSDLVHMVRSKHGILSRASRRVVATAASTSGESMKEMQSDWARKYSRKAARQSQPSWNEQVSDLLPGPLRLDP